MAREVAFLSLLTLQVLLAASGVHGSCCNLKCNPRASVGCIGFDTSDLHECMGVVCPEVHVESCTNPCRMTTQSFSVPKSCCCAPYCTLPGPQTICTTTPVCASNCGQDIYKTSNNCPGVQLHSPRPPPPPPQPMQRYGCCMPYGYPPQIMPQPAAPSYCVQSVVVGGKAVTPERNGEENGGGNPEGVGNPVGSNPGNRTGSGGGNPLGAGGPLGRLNPGSLGLDPWKLEKILDAIRDKLEPDCVGPSPMVVMPQSCGCSCSPRVRVKKIRRKQRRKYMIESCEEPDVIVEEEEDPSYVLAAPFCPARSCCCCRARRCGCRSCCY